MGCHALPSPACSGQLGFVGLKNRAAMGSFKIASPIQMCSNTSELGCPANKLTACICQTGQALNPFGFKNATRTSVPWSKHGMYDYVGYGHPMSSHCHYHPGLKRIEWNGYSILNPYEWDHPFVICVGKYIVWNNNPCFDHGWHGWPWHILAAKPFRRACSPPAAKGTATSHRSRKCCSWPDENWLNWDNDRYCSSSINFYWRIHLVWRLVSRCVGLRFKGIG